MLMHKNGIFRDVSDEDVFTFSSKGYVAVEKKDEKEIAKINLKRMNALQLEEYAIELGVDISDAKTNAEKTAAIQAYLDETEKQQEGEE